jgi:hypothetical protein
MIVIRYFIIFTAQCHSYYLFPDKKEGDSNNDIFFSTTPNPDKDLNNNLDGGQSNVKGSGKNGGAALVVSPTLTFVLLSAVVISFFTFGCRNDI